MSEQRAAINCTCHNSLVPVSSRGSDGYDPCPDCGPEVECSLGADCDDTLCEHGSGSSGPTS